MSPASKPRQARVQPTGPDAASSARWKRFRREYLRRLLAPALALLAVAIVESFNWTPFKLSAPQPFLLLTVVCATFVGGLVDGLIAAGITVWYYAYFASAPGTTFPYSHEALRNVLIFACSAPAAVLMVGLLKQRAARIAAEAARKDRESADAVYTSLTWTREAERSGREVERRFRRFFDASAVGVMHTRGEGKVIECNQTFVDFLGFDSREEVMAMEADRLFEDPAAYRNLLGKLGRSVEVAEADLALWRRNGQPLWVRARVRRLDDPSSTLFELSVVDIARQRQAETLAAGFQSELERRRSEQAALLRESEGFALAVAYDLRGPLRRIDEISQTLVASYGLKLDAAGRESLIRLAASSAAMERLVQSLIELTRASGGDMRRNAVDLSALVESIVQVLRSRDPKRQVDVVIAKGLTAVGDSALLRQALTHLVNNAWAFTSGRAAARIEFGETKSDGRVAYVVRDDGAGFDRAYTGPVPGAIQRLRSADEWAGAGLALAMVHRIVQRHGGRVWAEGSPEGAAFFFTLGEAPGPPSSATA